MCAGGDDPDFCESRCVSRAAVRPRDLVCRNQPRAAAVRGCPPMRNPVILVLAVKSLRNRKFTAALTVLSIALAVLLLLGVERIRHESRESFAATISGTDLVVGARSSPVHLLLAAVFHIGN